MSGHDFWAFIFSTTLAALLGFGLAHWLASKYPFHGVGRHFESTHSEGMRFGVIDFE
jgi:type IV secretory pathway TrbD component